MRARVCVCEYVSLSHSISSYCAPVIATAILSTSSRQETTLFSRSHARTRHLMSASSSSPTIRYYRCQSDIDRDQPIDTSLVSQSKGVLRSDKSPVLTRVTIDSMNDHTFARVPLSHLKGKTAFHIWIPSKGKFYVFSCLEFERTKLRLNLESYGAWPEEGAEPERLVNLLSNKYWPEELTR